MAASEIAPEIKSIAKQVGAAVEAEVIHMLTRNQEGEIITVLGFNEVQAYAKIKEPIWRHKLNRGHWTVLTRSKV